MSDTISRRAAIDALERKKDKNARGEVGGFYNKIIQNDIDTLMQLPSAQPERKNGKWIEKKGNAYRCSCCGKQIITNPDYIKTHKFCFSCGAKMEVDSEAD